MKREFVVCSLCSFLFLALNPADYEVIYKRNLFGSQIEKKSILKKEVEVPVEEKFILKGTAVIGGNRSIAVIEDSSTKREGVYKEGDFLGDFQIIRIEDFSILLKEKDGKEVSLKLKEGKGEILAHSPVDIFPQNLNQKSSEISKISLSELLPQFKKELPKLSSIRVAPRLISGRVNGYQVRNLPAGSLPERLGLKNGDIVSRVNGVLIDSVQRGYEIYRNLKPNSPVRVSIIRKGRPITLNFNLSP